MSTTKESAEARQRREDRELIIRTLRPSLREKLALGLKIPKGWDKLFDIKKEQADLDELIERGAL